MGFFDRFKREPARVEHDAEGVRNFTGRGTVEMIKWDELAEVGIVTTSDGPAVDDVFWLLMNADRSRGCSISSATPGMDAVLARLQQLPGFDHEQVIRAMGSCDDASFRVWKR